MVSYPNKIKMKKYVVFVLILIVVEDGLVL